MTKKDKMTKTDKLILIGLLKKVLNYILTNELEYGICKIVSILHHINAFDDIDYDKIYDYIQDNRPKEGELLYEKKRDILNQHYDNSLNTAYYWKKGVKAPRIKWLRLHIKQLTS